MTLGSNLGLDDTMALGGSSPTISVWPLLCCSLQTQTMSQALAQLPGLSIGPRGNLGYRLQHRPWMLLGHGPRNKSHSAV